MTNKPAATGSGEPQKSYVAHKFVASGNGNKCGICSVAHGGDASTWVPDEPTSPASQPTVTLSKETREEVIRWMHERYDNCLRIASQKDGEDRAGWLHDALYFDTALALLRAAEQK